MRYSHARLPGTGILIGLDDANFDLYITTANTNDLATTSMPASRAVETCITQHKMYEWCVVVANGIFMDRCSWCKKVRWRRLRRRFAVLLRDARTQLHHTSSQPACNLVYFGVLHTCHKDGTLCSFGHGMTSGLPYTRKGCVGEAPRCCFGSSLSSQLVSHCRATLWSSAPPLMGCR